MVLSLEQVAISVASKLKVIDLTSFSWPSRGEIGSKSSPSCRHITAVASNEADPKHNRSFTFGHHAT